MSDAENAEHFTLSDPLSTKPIQLIWGLARLPVILAVLYALRHPVLNAIESVFDIIWITETAVDVMSTPATRLILLAGAFAGLVTLRVAARRLLPSADYVIATALGSAAIGAVLILTQSDRKWFLLLDRKSVV